MTTIEGDYLIAKFMGEPVRKNVNGEPVIKIGRYSSKLLKDWAKYSSSWDALMPVVEKIESIEVDGTEDTAIGIKPVKWSFNVEIENGQALIHRYCSPQYYGEESDFLKLYDCRKQSKIESTWCAVVQFIQWYNRECKCSDSFRAAHGLCHNCPFKSTKERDQWYNTQKQ